MTLSVYDGTESADEIAKDRELDLLFVSDVLVFDGTEEELIEKYGTWLIELAAEMTDEKSDGPMSGDSAAIDV